MSEGAGTAEETVDGYIAAAPPAVAEALTRMRETILAAVPGCVEGMAYHMPGVRLEGRVVAYYAGWKAHVALYAVGPLGGALEEEVAPYRAAKDTLRFPLGKPVPYDLVARVVPRLVELRFAADRPGSTA
jgi:uncharacterized protein YdhG (YjbR/CyaY superfamily)